MILTSKPDVCIIGGGMITEVQILPSVYHLQRQGSVGDISVCARTSETVQKLTNNQALKEAFPGQTFSAYPSLDTPVDKVHHDNYQEMIKSLPDQSIVIIAIPDQVHYEVIMTALAHNHHILCVKPLVLKYDQSVEIEKLAFEKGLVVGIEYHKRLDDRALIARRQYQDGQFGAFRIGHAEMNEPFYYRHSNFQTWCTRENTDMFSYVGCHYVDQLHFITGLLPTSISVYGIEDKYPNGNIGYLWTDARIIWDNGGCLHVTNTMGYPDEGPGGNFQGIRMYCAGDDTSGMLIHNDQNRGVEHCYIKKGCDPGDTLYAQPSPDYFKYVDLGGGGLTPVGYGYRSIAYIIENIRKTLAFSGDLPQRQKLIQQFDTKGIMATPKNSAYNELIMEAGRLSILNDGREVKINYGKNAGVAFKTY
jgi:predicted dehydrogenase